MIKHHLTVIVSVDLKKLNMYIRIITGTYVCIRKLGLRCDITIIQYISHDYHDNYIYCENFIIINSTCVTIMNKNVSD